MRAVPGDVDADEAVGVGGDVERLDRAAAGAGGGGQGRGVDLDEQAAREQRLGQPREAGLGQAGAARELHPSERAVQEHLEGDGLGRPVERGPRRRHAHFLPPR
ncbi:hypothetical protein [Cellulomonas endophytica]|uniref:hypothetical protein n=1 Tax=Cellulomonas endophytica TaxID=2494735 RepID=UPI001F0BD922|nr:hypothetical protein [Cellulomonas endophytica]